MLNKIIACTNKMSVATHKTSLNLNIGNNNVNNERIALFTGFMDPFHIMHASMGHEIINRGLADRVIYLPNTSKRKPNATPFEMRFAKIQKSVNLFDGLFEVSDLKKDRNNSQMMEKMIEKLGISKTYIWIASDTGKSAKRLLNNPENKEFRDMINTVISPYCNQYIFFHEEKSSVANDLKNHKEVTTIPLRIFPEEIRNIHSTDIRNKKIECLFQKKGKKVEITIKKSSK